MRLSDNVTYRIPNYENLKKFQVSTERVTNVCSRVKLKSSDVEIGIDVEEQESYLSFIIRQIINGKTYIYSALSDYSNVSGEKRPLFASAKDEKYFNDSVVQAIKNHRKLFTKDKNGDGIVTCVLSFLNEFMKTLSK